MSDPHHHPRLLAIAECLPRPDVSAGSSRFLAMLAQLARMTRVSLWVEHDETTGDTPLAPSRVAADRARLSALGVEVLPCTWQALRQTLAGAPYDTVLFEFYYTSARYLPLIRDAWPGAATIVDSVDLHFARLATGASLGVVHPTWAGDVRRAEIAAYRAADAVIVASADDAAVLAEQPEMPPVVCVPVCVTPRPRRRQSRPPRALFVGHFRHDPNLDGLSWFVHDVWPLVRTRHLEATVGVIGSYPSAAVHALGAHPGVDVLGYVPDLALDLDRAAVAIAPLRFGAGMKGKVTDAMAAGLPVVTTSVGAQGLDAVHDRHAMIADTAADFAAALSALFDDPDRAAAIGLAGQAHITAICGPAAMADALRTTLDAAQRVRRADTRTSVVSRRWRLVRCGLDHWRLTRTRRRAASAASGRTGLGGDGGPGS